jgi:deoxyribodipyrimidine photolyase-related protein
MSALADLAPSECVVLMIESLERSQALKYHKQKILLLWSAMRHFAEELRGLGYTVDYYQNLPDFDTGLSRHLVKYRSGLIRLMEGAEYHAHRGLARLARSMGLDVEITPNNMFLSDRKEFLNHAQGKKSLRMEFFYRRIRRQTGLMMDAGEPVGGQWNYDRDNRARPPSGHVYPPIPDMKADEITRRVARVIKQDFADHFGNLEDFNWPVTRQGARKFFLDFLDNRLDSFGPYEDAMVAGERALYHSLLSPMLNMGLLDPLEVARQAEERFRKGRARLNSVEGFIRQIVGWREFVYQVYHHKMPGYEKSNALGADLPLPDFYWTGETDMACCADAVKGLRRWGINHHIQRLMVTGNFALLAGINPQAVNEWYWLAYTDAFHWVVTPNVLGMALYADGGVFATKPYAASAAYINRMSDYCGGCAYDPKKKTGVDSCPFNSLYWDFLIRNRILLGKNPRMNMIMSTLGKRPVQELKDIQKRAAQVRTKLLSGDHI